MKADITEIRERCNAYLVAKEEWERQFLKAKREREKNIINKQSESLVIKATVNLDVAERNLRACSTQDIPVLLSYIAEN